MKTSLVSLINRSNASSVGLTALVAGISANMHSEGGAAIMPGSLSGSFLTTEGFSQSDEGTVVESLQRLQSVIQSARKDAGYKLTGGAVTDTDHYLVQESAAIAGAVMASSPLSTLRSMPANFAQLRGLSNDSTFVLDTPGSIETVERRHVTAEAYDNSSNTSSLVYTAAYNLCGARQNSFGEAFYPTLVISPENVGYTVSVRVLYLQDDFKRNVNGSLDKFNRHNLLRAIIYPDMLRNNTTQIIPYYRKAGTAAPTDNFTNFADAVGQTTVTVDGEAIPTAPLAFNKEFSLLGLSQNNATLATGNLDTTDAIAPSIRLTGLYLKLTGTVASVATTEYFKIDTKFFNSSDFVAAPQNNSRTQQLNLITDAIVFKSTTKQADGTASALLAPLATRLVRLGAQVNGTVTLDTSNTLLMASPLSVKAVREADANNGVDLALDTGSGAAAAAIFASGNASLVGFDLLAYRTNSNRRQRGQLIDTQTLNYVYTIPLLPPITALRPVGETDANDMTSLSTLIQSTYVRASIAGVVALEEARVALKNFVYSGAPEDDAPNILGAARHLVKCTYKEDAIDCAVDINSLDTAGRSADLNALLLNRIRDMAYRMVTESGFSVAQEAMNGGVPSRPLLIIGTDPTIHRYLTQQGDLRTIGDNFDCRIESTININVRGKIYLALGEATAYNSNVPAPLHNGNMAWKPEVTVSMPMVTNGAQSHQLTVNPSFRHVQNLPVMGYLTVANIEQVIGKNVAVRTHEVI